MTRKNYNNLGLLILRLGLGFSFVFHSYPLLMGGSYIWYDLGNSISTFGIYLSETVLTYLGLAAIILQLISGIFLILGVFTQQAAFSLILTLGIATGMHIMDGDSFEIYSHPLELCIVFFSILLIGPGDYTVIEFLLNKRRYH